MQAQAAAQPQPQRARRIGIVTAIEGWRLTGAVVTEPAAGRVADTIPQFGALVRIKAPESNLYGLISRIWLREGNNGPAGAVAMFEIEILGEIVESGSASGKFRRGISSYPHVGSEIVETAREEIARVYALPGSANS